MLCENLILFPLSQQRSRKGLRPVIVYIALTYLSDHKFRKGRRNIAREATSEFFKIDEKRDYDLKITAFVVRLTP